MDEELLERFIATFDYHSTIDSLPQYQKAASCFSAAELLLKEKQYARAIEFYKKSLGFFAGKYKTALCLKRMGLAYEELGLRSDAIENYEKALCLDAKIGVKKRLAALKKVKSI